MTATWADYYHKTAHRPPCNTLLTALDHFDAEQSRPRDGSRLAIDLGCGGGRDTVEILRRGWSVLAIDAEPAALEYLNSRRDLPHKERLTTQCEPFEALSLPPALLISSSFALPLCAPAAFETLWSQIGAALLPGGRFAGQFFGDRDSWNSGNSPHKGVTFLCVGQAQSMLEPFVPEMFEEEESDSTTPRGEHKHWHVMHIVARKT